MATTPIPVLYVISKSPLLQDKIISETALVILKAKAQNNIVAEDYERWNGSAPEWTPYGSVNKILKSRAKGRETSIHPQIIVSSQILEKLTKCKFHLGSRNTAVELHKQGLLIPHQPDISIWTDGSLSREGAITSNEHICGAVSIVHIRKVQDSEMEPTQPIITKLMIPNAVSSYETEIIAIQVGLEAAKNESPNGRAIHLFTDSLSCLQQLACLSYKYKYTVS